MISSDLSVSNQEVTAAIPTPLDSFEVLRAELMGDSGDAVP